MPELFYIRRYRENSIMTSGMNQKKCRDIVRNQEMMWGYLNDQIQVERYKQLVRKFMSFGVLDSFHALAVYPDVEFSNERRQELVQIFFENCFVYYRDDELLWGDYVSLCRVLKELKHIAGTVTYRNMIGHYFGSEDEFLQYSNVIEKKVLEGIVRKLQRLPLQMKGKKIGIYGIGNHTAELIDSYRKMIGEIVCNYYFIVSEGNKSMFFDGRRVISCDEVDHDTDYIIISSRLHQRKMTELLLNHGIEECKILHLYNQDDICDLVTAKKALGIDTCS